MSYVSVSEAASLLGVRVQRVHQRISDGSLPAERVGHQWIIARSDLMRLDKRSAGRPLSARSAWAMIAAADDNPAARDRLSPADRSRARRRLAELRASVEAASDDEAGSDALSASLRCLLGGRARRRVLRAADADLRDLREDARLVRSGVSRPESELASGGFVEAYIAPANLPDLREQYLLEDARPEKANVVLHVVKEPMPRGDVPCDNWLLLAADLAEHRRPREQARSLAILKDFARQERPLDS